MNESVERLINLTNRYEPKLAEKTMKIANEKETAFLHALKERKLAEKYFIFLLKLVEPTYAHTLTCLFGEIKDYQYEIISNTGWVVGSKECYYLENSFYGREILYHLNRDEEGYYPPHDATEYQNFIETSFYNNNKARLEAMHNLYTYRDELISVILYFTDEHNDELVKLIVEYLGLGTIIDREYLSEDVNILSRVK